MSKRLRILMTTDTVGGVWTYALELTRALQTHDVDVLLATMGPHPNSAQREQAFSIPNLTLFKSEYKLEWMPDCWSDVTHAGNWLLHLENRLQPDVIHLNGYAHAKLPWQRPTLVAGHSCVFSWWQAVHGETPPAEWQRYKDEVSSGLLAADRVVTPSAAMLHALNTHYGPTRNASVIPNGRNPEDFKPAKKEQFIMSAGRLWDAAKNIERLAAIAPELPWPVFVAGDLQHPQQNVQNSCLAEHCRWLGALSETELRTWFARAPIYALPALYEPFGYTPLEAGLSGCALVLGDIESLREIWSDAAVFVDPNDSEALKSALLRLINDEPHHLEMAQRARARALEFTSARMAESYFEAYLELLPRARTTNAQEALAECA